MIRSDAQTRIEPAGPGLVHARLRRRPSSLSRWWWGGGPHVPWATHGGPRGRGVDEPAHVLHPLHHQPPLHRRRPCDQPRPPKQTPNLACLSAPCLPRPNGMEYAPFFPVQRPCSTPSRRCPRCLPFPYGRFPLNSAKCFFLYTSSTYVLFRLLISKEEEKEGRILAHPHKQREGFARGFFFFC
ncbi:hypothetical protein BS78_02G217300 [Paspalum vaginatum]|nr:hypothetical protein BS78_02G217300 [Paspalum vaginatum]